MGVYDPGFDPGEELGQMDHDELLEEVIKLRAERDKQNLQVSEYRKALEDLMKIASQWAMGRVR